MHTSIYKWPTFTFPKQLASVLLCSYDVMTSKKRGWHSDCPNLSGIPKYGFEATARTKMLGASLQPCLLFHANMHQKLVVGTNVTSISYHHLINSGRTIDAVASAFHSVKNPRVHMGASENGFLPPKKAILIRMMINQRVEWGFPCFPIIFKHTHKVSSFTPLGWGPDVSPRSSRNSSSTLEKGSWGWGWGPAQWTTVPNPKKVSAAGHWACHHALSCCETGRIDPWWSMMIHDDPWWNGLKSSGGSEASGTT